MAYASITNGNGALGAWFFISFIVLAAFMFLVLRTMRRRTVTKT
ncbi:MAG: hypothetical protein ABIA93_02905 [Candidatus Woesearchaeota archaeon]